MGWKLEKFFSSSLERNGKGQRQDVEEPVIAFGTGRSESSELGGDFEGYFKSLVYGKWFHGETQHKWIPQGQDTSSWDIVRWFVNGQKNVFHCRNLNNGSSTSSQNMRRSRGTGTYIPEMVKSIHHFSPSVFCLWVFVWSIRFCFCRVSNLMQTGSVANQAQWTHCLQHLSLNLSNRIFELVSFG